jgi:hypothetical protein
MTKYQSLFSIFAFFLPNVSGQKRDGEKVHMAVLFENNVSFLSINMYIFT